VQNPKLFAKRMLKLSKTQKFSFREKKLLFKIIKEARESRIIDYPKLMYMFPGKTFASIQRQLKTKLRLKLWVQKYS
jgi:hypothetical protein